jgi:hypothetical protein
MSDADHADNEIQNFARSERERAEAQASRLAARAAWIATHGNGPGPHSSDWTRRTNEPAQLQEWLAQLNEFNARLAANE